jgi:hypothetical protein
VNIGADAHALSLLVPSTEFTIRTDMLPNQILWQIQGLVKAIAVDKSKNILGELNQVRCYFAVGIRRLKIIF